MRRVRGGEKVEHVEEVVWAVVVLQGIASYAEADERQRGKECGEGRHFCY